MPEAHPLALEVDWAKAAPLRYGDRQQIFLQGEKRRHIYRVESGCVCLYRAMPRGERYMFAFKFRNDIMGLSAISEHTLSAQAIGTTVLRAMPLKPLYERAARDPAYALQLYRALSVELEGTRNLVTTLRLKSPLERLAAFLCKLMLANEGSEQNSIDLAMKRSDIADMLGMTVETVSRALAGLSKAALIEITGRQKIKITDMGALRHLARKTGETENIAYSI